MSFPIMKTESLSFSTCMDGETITGKVLPAAGICSVQTIFAIIASTGHAELKAERGIFSRWKARTICFIAYFPTGNSWSATLSAPIC